MEIVIENEPYRPASASPGPGFLRSPLSAQPLVNSGSAFYYATLPRGKPGPPPLDGAPTNSVRRVDKSGLLGVTDREPLRSGLGDSATLSRRLERPSLLEAVPELPDQCGRVVGHQRRGASDELLAAAATARSMVERQQHLLGAETDVVESALLRRRAFAATVDAPAVEPPDKQQSTRRVKFASDEISSLEEQAPPPPQPQPGQKKGASVVSDCLGRLSPRQRDRQQMSLSNVIPDVIEAHGSSGSSAGGGGAAGKPEGERAEAEGCEHTAIEAVEEARYNTPTGQSAKDNIQAVHVIILSEQL